MQLSEPEKIATLKTIARYPQANLDAYFRGRYLYVAMDGNPLCRLEPAGEGLWLCAIFLWSSERYSKNEFSFEPLPLSLAEELDFAVNLMS